MGADLTKLHQEAMIQYKKKNYSQAFKLLNELAKKDTTNGEVYYLIGTMYLEGSGVEKNSDLAYKYFKDSHYLGYPAGTYKLGEMLLNGNGTDKNEKLSFKYFKEAHDKGYLEGTWRIGMAYYYGLGVDRDIFGKSKEFFEEAHKKGHIDSTFKLGYICMTDPNFKDKNIALEYIRQAHSLGNLEATYWLGYYMLYHNLDSNKSNNKDALDLFKLAHVGGNPDATYIIGIMLYKGYGTEVNIVESLKYFESAIKLGHKGDFNVYNAYADYLSKYVLDGLDNIIKMANDGYISAMKFLVEAASEGIYGIKKNRREAFNWAIKLYKLNKINGSDLTNLFGSQLCEPYHELVGENKKDFLDEELFDLFAAEYKLTSVNNFKKAKNDFQNNIADLVPAYMRKKIIPLIE